ncbi:MAG: hypothetical protein KME22_25170 [Hassallia sp. WJT32-NPBG1]|nr:hypothetical protein [Hassallia sp. WJT32-NPBG1]
MNTRFLQQISLVSLAAAIATFGSFKAQAQATATPTNTQLSNKAADLYLWAQVPEQTTPAPLQQPIQDPTTPAPLQQPIQDPTTPAPVVSPGRATRGGPSYIGVGGNLGIAGETTLSEGSFAVISKLGLTNNLSVRPTALIGDNAVFLVPVTLDFPVESVTETGEAQISAAPYLGGGVAISTGDDSNVGFLLSGGVDVPIANQLTANAGVNVSFLDDTNIGLLLGVGYNF